MFVLNDPILTPVSRASDNPVRFLCTGLRSPRQTRQSLFGSAGGGLERPGIFAQATTQRVLV
jgi:hypothetical protein